MKPKDIGVRERKDVEGEGYLGLKHCGNAPNCFCSTDSIAEDPDHNIPAWEWPQSMNRKEAFTELIQVVNAYQPGQGNIDGGGFKVIKADAEGGYIYVQFESFKNGYVDDLEFAYIESAGKGSVQLRSSSRLGYLDFGVNAKRVNYISKALKEKGWNAPGVNLDLHVNYAIQNQMV
uniref:Uncharacterized protein n=1 Tax=Corethron hystrix TaxID=216773 RepID=A0A7S1B6T7_9STRA|mmetsp:Transcript_15144/g.33866  ORF Transcript_15144/g.33866 Transcript_15144/m.33866 type:complete len:176 (+) Transcript_15144:662-1189(+)